MTATRVRLMLIMAAVAVDDYVAFSLDNSRFMATVWASVNGLRVVRGTERLDRTATARRETRT